MRSASRRIVERRPWRVAQLRRARTRRRGASILELSIILPLLLTITFGTMVWAWVFFVRGTMYHAAREAARAISVQQKTTAEATQIAQDILHVALSSYTFDVEIINTVNPEIEVTVSIPVENVGFSQLVPLVADTMEAHVIIEREGF